MYIYIYIYIYGRCKGIYPQFLWTKISGNCTDTLQRLDPGPRFFHMSKLSYEIHVASTTYLHYQIHACFFCIFSYLFHTFPVDLPFNPGIAISALFRAIPLSLEHPLTRCFLTHPVDFPRKKKIHP